MAEITVEKALLTDRKCSVATCTKWKTEARTLHPIPSKDAFVQIRWFSFIRVSRGPGWTPSDDNNAPMVCNLHFLKRNFSYSSTNKKLCLRSIACPSVQEPSNKISKGTEKYKPDRHDDDNDSIVSPMHEKSDSCKDCDETRTSIPSETSCSALTNPCENSKRIVVETARGNDSDKREESSNSATIKDAVNVSSSSLSSQENSTKMMTQRPILPQPPPVTSKFPIQDSIPFQQLPIFIVPSGSNGGQFASQPTIPANFLNSSSLPSGNKSQLFHKQIQIPKNFGLGHLSKYNIPTVMTFCLICNKNFETIKGESIGLSEKNRAKDVLLKILNIQTGDLEITDSHPICYHCNYKILDLQDSVDKLIEKQKEMENQRNDLLRQIVRTYCERISSSAKGFSKFCNSSVVHNQIVKTWASTLTPPPFLTTEPPCRKNLSTLYQDVVRAIRRKRADRERSRRREKNKDKLAERKRLKEEKLARRQYLSARRHETKVKRLQGERIKYIRRTEKSECPVCKIEILQHSMTNHMKTHAGDKPHVCQVCGRKFLREANLKTHRMSHGIGNLKFGRGDRVYVCQYCEKQIRHGKSFFRHLTTHFGKEIEGDTETMVFYHCDYMDCPLSFNTVVGFQSHLFTHSEEPPECSSCFKRFASTNNFDSHQRVHLENQNPLFDCSYCHEYFETEEALNSHNDSHQIHIDLTAFNVKCDQCEEIFVCDLHFQQHRQSKHPDESGKLSKSEKRNYQNLICEVCGVEFKAESRLRMHSYEHTHPEGFPCECCRQTFPNPTKLWLHKKKRTCQDSSQISPESGTASGTKQNTTQERLKLSQNTRESKGSKSKQKTKLLQCKHCKFVSRGSNYLFRRHLLINHPDLYVNGKPFFCHVCWQNYGTQEELSQHQSTSHSRLICKTCNKVFGNIVRLQLHHRVHTGEKPFKCQYCDKRFNLESNLREHEYRHTGMKPYKCSNCSAGFLRKKLLMLHIAKLHPTGKEAESSDEGQNHGTLLDFSNLM